MGTACCSDRLSRPSELQSPYPKLHSKPSTTPASESNYEESEVVNETYSEESESVNQPGGTIPKEIRDQLDATFAGAQSFWWKERTAVLEQHRVRVFDEGQVVYTMGNKVDAVYVLFSGLVEILGEDITEVGPMEELFLNEAMERDTYPLTAIAKVQSEVYAFPISTFLYPPHVLAVASLILACPILKTFIENREGLEAVECCEYPSDLTISLRPGEPNYLLIILHGEIKRRDIAIGRGQWFGVHPHNPEYLIIETVVGFRLSQSVLEDCFGSRALKLFWYYEFLDILQKDPVLSNLKEADMVACYIAAKFKSLAPGKVLVSASKPQGSRAFVILKGACGRESGEIMGTEGEVCNLRVISESECLTFHEDVVAKEQSVIACIPRRTLRKVLPPKLIRRLQAEATQEELKKVPLFAGMPLKLLTEIGNSLTPREFSTGATIIESGNIVQRLFLILSGQAARIVEGKIAEQFRRFDYLGEAYLLNQATQKSVIALGKVLCWEINFFQMGVFMDDVKAELSQRIRTKVFGVNVDQLVVVSEAVNPLAVKTLQAVIKDKGNERQYGILVYSREGDQGSIQKEIGIIRDLNSPFLLYLQGHLTTQTYNMIVFRFFPGEQLSHILKTRAEELNEMMIRVYAACCLLALKAMHAKGIVHLNLCPEHVFITVIGFPVLIQYRAAQRLNSIHTASILQHRYSAPELLKEGRISPLCDLWGVGIVMLECFRAMLKFEAIQFTKQAISELLEKMQGLVTSTALSLLQLLLVNRSDSELTVDAVMTHTWFSKMNWQDLTKLKSEMFHLLKPGLIRKGVTRLPQPISLSEYMRTVLHDSDEIVQVG